MTRPIEDADLQELVDRCIVGHTKYKRPAEDLGGMEEELWKLIRRKVGDIGAAAKVGEKIDDGNTIVIAEPFTEEERSHAKKIASGITDHYLNWQKYEYFHHQLPVTIAAEYVRRGNFIMSADGQYKIIELGSIHGKKIVHVRNSPDWSAGSRNTDAEYDAMLAAYGLTG